jgi:hypothetical protein
MLFLQHEWSFVNSPSDSESNHSRNRTLTSSPFAYLTQIGARRGSSELWSRLTMAFHIGFVDVAWLSCWANRSRRRAVRPPDIRAFGPTEWLG